MVDPLSQKGISIDISKVNIGKYGQRWEFLIKQYVFIIFQSVFGCLNLWRRFHFEFHHLSIGIQYLNYLPTASNLLWMNMLIIIVCFLYKKSYFSLLEQYNIDTLESEYTNLGFWFSWKVSVLQFPISLNCQTTSQISLNFPRIKNSSG